MAARTSTSALDTGEWSASRPGRFTSKEIAPKYYWMGDWVRPRACLDTVARRKYPSPCRESNPGHPARSLVTVLSELQVPARPTAIRISYRNV
jgi:hypothetical protein